LCAHRSKYTHDVPGKLVCLVAAVVETRLAEARPDAVVQTHIQGTSNVSTFDNTTWLAPWPAIPILAKNCVSGSVGIGSVASAAVGSTGIRYGVPAAVNCRTQRR